MSTQLAVVKGYMEKPEVKKRFNDILQKKSNAFMASVINTVTNSYNLQNCEPGSIMNAALTAAALDLPIDPNLGFAALVPYGSKAQFQIMVKGFVQLAIRSGLYADMNVTEVYSDEIKRYNPIKGELEFNEDQTEYAMREEGKEENIVGFYAWFKLQSGFEKSLYMTKKAAYNHGKQFSKSFQYDLKNGYKKSLWSTDFTKMGIKTVLKLLLSKWGILSVEMQSAIVDDQKVYDESKGDYYDNPDTPDEEPNISQAPPENNPVDVNFQEVDDNPFTEEAPADDAPPADQIPLGF